MSSVLCTFCNHTNVAGAKFCNECGCPLRVKLCKRCNAVNDVDVENCRACGADVMDAAPQLGEPVPTFLLGGDQGQSSFNQAEPSFEFVSSLASTGAASEAGTRNEAGTASEARSGLHVVQPTNEGVEFQNARAPENSAASPPLDSSRRESPPRTPDPAPPERGLASNARVSGRRDHHSHEVHRTQGPWRAIATMLVLLATFGVAFYGYDKFGHIPGPTQAASRTSLGTTTPSAAMPVNQEQPATPITPIDGPVTPITPIEGTGASDKSAPDGPPDTRETSAATTQRSDAPVAASTGIGTDAVTGSSLAGSGSVKSAAQRTSRASQGNNPGTARRTRPLPSPMPPVQSPAPPQPLTPSTPCTDNVAALGLCSKDGT